MDEIKNDAYYLKKILADLEFILEQTKEKDEKEITSNPLLMDSVCFRLIQISENNDKLTAEFKAAHSQVSWKAIKGMRNRIVHDYGVINPAILYDTVKNSIPTFYNILKDSL